MKKRIPVRFLIFFSKSQERSLNLQANQCTQCSKTDEFEGLVSGPNQICLITISSADVYLICNSVDFTAPMLEKEIKTGFPVPVLIVCGLFCLYGTGMYGSYSYAKNPLWTTGTFSVIEAGKHWTVKV
jgi:hypothetical protein